MDKKKRNIWKIIAYTVLIIVIIWFCMVLFEYYRVKNNKRPLLCFGYHEVVEDNDEYSLLCHGILYKYKEYYYKTDKSMSARELTMFFTEFTRDTKRNSQY